MRRDWVRELLNGDCSDHAHLVGPLLYNFCINGCSATGPVLNFPLTLTLSLQGRGLDVAVCEACGEEAERAFGALRNSPLLPTDSDEGFQVLQRVEIAALRQ